jgi:formylglycine-generating enzyme required for sulfatase activity
MKKTFVFALIVFVMAAANSASADVIRGISMDFVTIGNAGNAGDTRPEAYPYGCGAVGYNYRIGKYEITASQWQTINTAAGIGNSGSWSGNQPAGGISWYDAAQFCNYLTSGDRSKGVYKFSGNNVNPGSFLGIDRNAAKVAYGTTYFLPTEDEWYKAAYFKPDGSDYSLYANGTDTAPIAGVQSNYDNAIGAPWNVGTGTQEQNGTFDMMGNVWEWNEALTAGLFRAIRGGSYSNAEDVLGSSFRDSVIPSTRFQGTGFRIASVPEPVTLLLLGLGAVILRKRKK